MSLDANFKQRTRVPTSEQLLYECLGKYNTPVQRVWVNIS